MRYIVAFSVMFSFLFFSGVAESNENRYQKIEFSNENNFFETLSEALSTDLSTKEIQKAIKVFKVKQEVKNFKDAKSLIDAQPTSAKTLISNVRRLNLETNISELNLLKSHIFDVAKVNAGQSSVTKIPVAAVAVLPALAVLSGSGSSLPTLSVNDVATSDEAAGDATFTVTLSEASDDTVTVSYKTSNGTATSGADYTAVSATTLSFEPGVTSMEFTVAVLADSLDEANETVTLTLSNASNATILDATGTLTITDDDAAPTIDFNATSSSGAESVSSKAITVDLSAVSGQAVTVNYAITGTATGSGTDYTLAGGTLTIAAGSTSGTITIASIVNDTMDEVDETVIVTLSNASNATLGTDKVHTYTIMDNDAAPSLSINDVTTSNETAGNATFTVTLSAASGKTVIVSYATSNGTATAGADYTAVSATTLTFSPGDTTKTFTVGVLSDTNIEADETVTLTLSSVSNATISDATGTLTITDDDAAPSLSINDVTTSNENEANATFTVTLSTASGKTVTVNYATSNGTATAGSDYTAVSATTLTFSPGDTTKTFTVGVLADSLDEANETATLTLSSASNATILDATGTLTITDDDAAPTIDFNATSSSGAESVSSKAITVDLSAVSGQAVTVNYAITGTATGSGTDYTLAGGTLTISAGSTTGTVTIASIVNDALDEANETVIVTLSNASNATLGTDTAHTYTITDDDAAPSLSINDVTKAEAVGSTTTATFTVTLSVVSGQTVTVNYETSNGTATAGSDYTAITATTLTFSAGDTTKTFNVTVLADTSYETSETATLTLSSVSNATILDGTGTLTITDDFLNSGTQATYNSSLASTYEANTQFKNIEFYNPNKANEPSSWETINLHQAFGYNKFGSGKKIAILDNGFYVTEAGYSSDHDDLDSKTISTFGTFTTPTGTSCGSGSHGTCVMSAAGSDGTGVFGVAPLSSFHLTANNTLSGYTDLYSKFAASAADASSAVVLNNSWGHDFNIQLLQAKKIQNSWSSAQAFNYYISTTYSQSASSIQSYVDALDDFQDHGVVVYALTNDADFTDADISAGLAVLFPKLNEAFIAAANVDVYWNGSALSYVLMSGPCGQTASHCLAADGTDITLASHVSSGTSAYVNTQGTSFAAPTISGAIALLAEHFPNQTPEQWAKRLFASADNVLGFTQTGSVTFGNGVVHGYSDEAGHGMLDIYAALQPITSSSSARQLYAGANQLGGNSFDLDQSFVQSSRSFGDAISNALENERTYFYDALDGGFAFSLGELATEQAQLTSSGIKLAQNAIRPVKEELQEQIKINGLKKYASRDNYFESAIGISSRAVNEYFDDGTSNSIGNFNYFLPFLNNAQGGTGANLGFKTRSDNGFLTLSTMSKLNSDNTKDPDSTILATYEDNLMENLSYGLLIGDVNEGASLLGMEGSGAFDLGNSKSKTTLMNLKLKLNLKNNATLGVMGGLSKSYLNKTGHGLIQGMDEVLADNFALSYNVYGINMADKFTFSLSQPHRIRSGKMDIKIAGLADQDGAIPYVEKTVDLNPSGRQLDFSFGYARDLSKKMTVATQFTITKDSGHHKLDRPTGSIYLGLMRGKIFGQDKINLGAVLSNSANETNAKVNYSINW